MDDRKMIRYAGMSYEQASREAERLLKRAATNGNWHSIVDDLVFLRELMQRELRRAA
jgi:hypothetical protein